MTRHEGAHGGIVEMIVVVVRLEHDIERREIIERDPRWDPPSGTRERHRRGALAPHRIGEDVAAVDLNQQAGVSDPGNREL